MKLNNCLAEFRNFLFVEFFLTREKYSKNESMKNYQTIDSRSQKVGLFFLEDTLYQVQNGNKNSLADVSNA